MLKGTKGLFIMLVGVTLLILFLGLIIQTNQGKQTFLTTHLHLTPIGSLSTPSPLKTIKVGNTMVSAVIADNDTTRSKGLGGITNLPANQGMLFVFQTKQITPTFWMKSMQIPLDFIWISNGKVVEITPNVPNPAPNTPDSQLKLYTPSEPIDSILEVNAGFSIKNSVKVGDSVSGL